MKPLPGGKSGWRAGVVLATALAMVGCGPETPTGSDPSLLRNPTVPLGGTSRFHPAGFAGHWHVIACIGQCPREVTYTVTADGGMTRQAGASTRIYTPVGPGVLRDIGQDHRLVIMWVDEGFRTAAVGDADGQWAAILDRGRGASDRTGAATEILDFNGWDTGKLRKMTR